MKLKLFVYSCLFFLVLGSSQSFAQSKNVLFWELRTQIEEKIRKNYEEVIGIQLQSGSYRVGVLVELKEEATEKKDSSSIAETSNNLPEGLNLGILDVRELISNYEQEIKTLKEKKTLQEPMSSEKFKIVRVNIKVGLNEDYGKEYQVEFSKWLSQRVKVDFGGIGTSETAMIRKIPEKPVSKKDPKSFENSTLYERLFDFQPLVIALVLISIGTLLFFSRFIISTADARLSKNVATEISGSTSNSLKMSDAIPANGIAQSSMKPEFDEEKRANEDLSLTIEDIDRLMSKITFLILDLSVQFSHLLSIWLDAGPEGHQKIALAFDSVISKKELFEKQGLTVQKFSLQDLSSELSEKVHESFLKVQQMKSKEKLQMLDSTYWDIISFKTFGPRVLRRPFDHLKILDDEQIGKVLLNQKRDVQALALLYLENNQKKNFMSKMNEDEKVHLIASMIGSATMSKSDLVDIDSAVKIAVEKSAVTDSGKIGLMPRSISLLENLSAIEELRILKRIVPVLPQQGASLKKKYFSLAFMEEWSEFGFEKISSVITADEVVALLKIFPEVKSALFSFIAPRMRTMVEDDLGSLTNMTNDQLNDKLESIRLKMKRFIEHNKINLSEFYSDSSSMEVADAA